MAKASLVLTARAEQDLEEIWFYSFQKWGIDRAENYITRLKDQFSQLEQNPGIGRQCGYIRTGYRRLEVEKHIIFYTHQNDTLAIIRILHESMDAPEHF